MKKPYLVDPCGKVRWSIIEKIGKLSNKKEGTELITNWSCPAIYRNKKNYQELSEIYGINLNLIQETFSHLIWPIGYYSLYEHQLKQYWEFVEPLIVPKALRITPKMNKFPVYYLLYCTNNKSGISLAKSSIKSIKEGLRAGQRDIMQIVEEMIQGVKKQ